MLRLSSPLQTELELSIKPCRLSGVVAVEWPCGRSNLGDGGPNMSRQNTELLLKNFLFKFP